MNPYFIVAAYVGAKVRRLKEGRSSKGSASVPRGHNRSKTNNPKKNGTLRRVPRTTKKASVSSVLKRLFRRR